MIHVTEIQRVAPSANLGRYLPGYDCLILDNGTAQIIPTQEGGFDAAVAYAAKLGYGIANIKTKMGF